MPCGAFFWQIFCIVSIISDYTQVLHDKLQWYASSLAKLKEILIVNIILQSRVKINYTTVLKITAKMLRTAKKGRNHQWKAQKMRLRTHAENLKNLCRCIKFSKHRSTVFSIASVFLHLISVISNLLESVVSMQQFAYQSTDKFKQNWSWC